MKPRRANERTTGVKQLLIYGIMACISPVSFWIADNYVDRYEGWGQWAAAPILLVPLLFALAVTTSGIITIIIKLRKNESPLTMIALTLMAASPIIYTLIR